MLEATDYLLVWS